MAKNEAKIRFTAETGGFNKEIQKANGEMSELRAELKLNETQMKATGATVESLEKKHSILENQLKASESKTEALNQKMLKAVDIFGEDSQEASKLRVQLLNAQTAEEKLRQAVEQCANELEDQKAAVNKLDQSLDDLDGGAGKVSSSAKDLDGNLKDVDKSASGAGSTLSMVAGTVCKGVVAGFAAVTAAAGAAVGAFLSAAESTREYREAQAKLDAAFKSAGKSAGSAESTYESLFRVIGESDQSVEAAQQIALLANSEENAGKWAEYASGVVGKFGDALQPETFFESANETIKLGEATGAFTQMLEGCGVNVEEFNKGLAKCKTEEEKNAYMLSVTEKALGAAGDAYEEANADILAANEATSAMDEAMAGIGAAAEPVMTTMKLFGAGILADLSPAVTLIGEGLTGAMNGTEGAAETLAQGIGDAVGTVVSVFQNVFGEVLKTLPSLVTNLAPVLVSGIEILISTAVGALPSLINMLTTSVLPQLITAVLSAADAVVSALPSVISSIASALPSLVGQLLIGAINLIVSLCTNLPLIIEPIISMLPDLLTSILTALLSNLPVLVQGLIGLVVALIPMIPQILLILLDAIQFTLQEQGLAAIIGLIPVLLVGIWDLIVALCKAIPGLLLSLIRVIFNPFIQMYATLTALFEPLSGWFNDNVVQPVIGFFQGLWAGMKVVWDGICNAVSVAIQFIGSILSAAFQIITLPFRLIWENCKEYVFDAFEWIKQKIGIAIGFIKDLVQLGFGFVKDKIITPIIEAKNKAVETFNGIRSSVQEKITALRTKVSEVFSSIKEKIQTPINNAKNKVSEIFSNIQSKISNTVSSIRSKVSSVFSSIKDKMTAPIQKARDTIKGIVDKIKGFFNSMKISLPKIKLPHFKITGKLSISPPSVPKLSIQWYKDGGIMTKPTIFGVNGNSLMAGGEAGPEAILPIDRLEGYISGAIEKAQNVVNLQSLADAIEDLANRPIQMNINGRQFATATANDSDGVNGLRTTFKNRGLALG